LNEPSKGGDEGMDKNAGQKNRMGEIDFPVNRLTKQVKV
jgi:hypothetical protein